MSPNASFPTARTMGPLTIPEPPAGRLAARLAGAVFAAAIGMIGVTLVAVARGWHQHVPMGYGAGVPALLSTELAAASASTVGFLVLRNRPRNGAAWILLALGVASAAEALGLYASAIMAAVPSSKLAAGAAGDGHLPLGGWLAAAGMQPAMGLLVGLLMFTFPDGRLVSRAWRPGVAVLVAGAGLRFAELAFGAQPLPYLPTLTNRFAAPGTLGAVLATAGAAGLGLFPLMGGMVIGLASLVVRYRRACPTTRLQVRGFVLAGSLVAATLVPLLYLFLSVRPALGEGEDLWVMFFGASSLFPLAVGAAITRYRLYDIDRIVNRTFVYGTLTAVLAGLFTTSVMLSQRLFVAVTGETSDLAIAATTLIVVSAYTPVRRWLERLSERFFRYEDPRFGEYQASLHAVLDILDPESAARELLEQAVTGLDAAGGCVELAVDRAADVNDPPFQTIARTSRPCEPVLTTPIQGRHGSIGQISLGARLDGRPYTAADATALAEAARLVGRAIEIGGRPLVGPTPSRRGERGPAWRRTGEPLSAATA